MIVTTGVDLGSLTAEAVAVGLTEQLRTEQLRTEQLRTEQQPSGGCPILAPARISVLPDPLDSAQAVLADLDQQLRQTGYDPHQPLTTAATGYGRERLVKQGLAARHFSEISCHGYGAFWAKEGIRTVIDIGGQDAKVIRVDRKGALENFAMNDKCAAGAGHFLEFMCRTLDISLEELGPLALRARKTIRMSSRCSVFNETEVLHNLQRGVPRADLAAGVCDAMADRVAALVRRIGIMPQLAMTGGVAKNSAIRQALEHRLEHRLLDFPLDPQLIGAYGAALLAHQAADSSNQRAKSPNRDNTEK